MRGVFPNVNLCGEATDAINTNKNAKVVQICGARI